MDVKHHASSRTRRQIRKDERKLKKLRRDCFHRRKPVSLLNQIHSFITKIYIAPLQGFYLGQLLTPTWLKRIVLRSTWKESEWGIITVQCEPFPEQGPTGWESSILLSWCENDWICHSVCVFFSSICVILFMVLQSFLTGDCLESQITAVSAAFQFNTICIGLIISSVYFTVKVLWWASLYFDFIHFFILCS